MFPGNSMHLVCIYNDFADIIRLLFFPPNRTNNIYAFFAANRIFDKLSDSFIHVDQLNAISHYSGVGNPPPLWHLRATYTLLGYTPYTTSFIKRAPAVHWVGRDPPDWHIKYKLFKKFKILNDKNFEGKQSKSCLAHC